MTFLALAIPLTLVAIAAATAQPPRDPRTIPIAYTVPGMDDVRVERDVVFRTVADTPLRTDVYLPRTAGPHPVVLLVSGGAVNDWRAADFYTSLARVLAAEGVAAVSYDKRLSREAASAETASDDTRALVDHLRQNASRYGIDPSKLCSWHFSAGGRVAGSMLADGTPAACVVLTYTILSFGAEEGNPRIAPHSALVQARERGAALPPTLVVRAGRDARPINDSIDAFVAAALSINAPVSLINYPAGDHAFEIVNDTDETRRVIRQTIAWLKSQIGG